MQIILEELKNEGKGGTGGWELHVKSVVARGFLISVKLAERGIALE